MIVIMQRNTLLAIAVLSLLAGLLCFPVPSPASPNSYLYGALARFQMNSSPRTLPDVDFLGEDSTPVKLSSFKGKMVILNLWATWCPYCVADMPKLNELQDTIGRDKLVVLAVSVDKEGYKHARKYVDGMGYNLSVYADPHSMVGTTMGTRGIPYALFFNKDGKEIGRLPGATNWMADEMLSFINYYTKD